MLAERMMQMQMMRTVTMLLRQVMMCLAVNLLVMSVLEKTMKKRKMLTVMSLMVRLRVKVKLRYTILEVMELQYHHQNVSCRRLSHLRSMSLLFHKIPTRKILEYSMEMTVSMSFSGFIEHYMRGYLQPKQAQHLLKQNGEIQKVQALWILMGVL
uniref:Uncharacterized protein n=1 Tax=Opuntia streptacantha TaxID=393608 RepID=A0A7C9FBQ6_OPUST